MRGTRPTRHLERTFCRVPYSSQRLCSSITLFNERLKIDLSKLVNDNLNFDQARRDDPQHSLELSEAHAELDKSAARNHLSHIA